MIESCFSQVANFCWKGTLFRAFCWEFYGISQNSYFSGRFWVLEFRPSEVSLSLKVLNTPLISKVEIARMAIYPKLEPINSKIRHKNFNLYSSNGF